MKSGWRKQVIGDMSLKGMLYTQASLLLAFCPQAAMKWNVTLPSLLVPTKMNCLAPDPETMDPSHQGLKPFLLQVGFLKYLVTVMGCRQKWSSQKSQDEALTRTAPWRREADSKVFSRCAQSPDLDNQGRGRWLSGLEYLICKDEDLSLNSYHLHKMQVSLRKAEKDPASLLVI